MRRINRIKEKIVKFENWEIRSRAFSNFLIFHFFKHILATVILLMLVDSVSAQITSGRIVFERKINLYKRFKDEDWVKDWVKERDHTKVDEFELFFNDSLSAFKPVESEEKENYTWMTSKNTVYQNLHANSRYSIKDVWRNLIHVTDSLYKRKWKITESKRNIGGYNCRKAIWQQNDSTRIYAWYSDEISTGVGPESFCGLPGMILGLATEDGGVIYFAKSIEPGPHDVTLMIPPKTKEQVYVSSELRAKLVKEYGKEKWSKEWIRNIFDNW